MPAPRDNRLELRLTDEERKLYEAAAEANGMTLSVWMRHACREKLMREKMADMGVIPFAVPRRRRTK